MNKNFLMLLGCAAGAAMLVAIFVKSAVTTSSDMVQILVARNQLPAGETAGKRDFEWVLWPKDAVPVDAVVETPEALDDLAGMRVVRGLLKGEPVIRSYLVDPEEAPFLEARLAEGKRAVSIPVKAESMVAGFVRPGSVVDVLMTYEIKLRGAEERAAAADLVARHASETVLSRVRVLAVDQDVTDMGKDAKTAKTVTLEVTVEQAEMLALARKMGDLSLVLRRHGDDLVVRQRDFTTDTQVGRALNKVMERTAEQKELKQRLEMLQRTVAARGSAPAGGAIPAANRAKIPERIRIYHGGQTSEFTY